MKKILITCIMLELIIFINPHNIINTTSYALKDKNNEKNTDEIIEIQKDNLNISDFIRESEKYTKQTLPDLDLNELLLTTIKGGVDNVKLARFLWGLLGKKF